MSSSPWLLPAGVEEGLPLDAVGLEELRRAVLDLFSSWGYELVMPPFIEYLDSLLDGADDELDLRTFKVTDQVSGRMLGLRADMTPQVARIDAHRLASGEEGGGRPNRLCYVGTVLHARNRRVSSSRCPIQVGAEIYGHAGVESDIEALALMLAMLERAGIERPHVDVGHLGVFRGLARGAALDEARQGALFTALQRKAQAEIEKLLGDAPAPWRDWLGALPALNGGRETLEEARARFADPRIPDEVGAALDALEAIAAYFERQGQPVHFDLAELRGYRYHGGVGFAAFVPGHGREIARGGRYDGMTRVAGEARPATGFSGDLRTLHRLGSAARVNGASCTGVFAPSPDEVSEADGGPAPLARAVSELRAAGERVVCRLPGQTAGAAAMNCDRELIRADGAWVVAPVGNDGKGARGRG